MLLETAVVVLLFLTLLLAGLWVPVAVGVPAILFLWLVGGYRAIGIIAWDTLSSYTLAAIPLYVLMAEILLRSGLTDRIFRGVSVLVRPLPGGLLQTNILSCALFAAVCGSSLASAVAIGTAALPQLLARGYDRAISAGSIAAGGTLGIMIPPSIAFIIYGSMTGTSIAKLFLAGFVPGALLVILFMIYIAVRSLIQPRIAPRETGRITLAEVRQVVTDVLPVVALIVFILGSLYFGFATPTETAAVGVVIAFVIALISGTMTFGKLRLALRSTASVTGSLLMIVMSGMFFSAAIAMSGVGSAFTSFVIDMHLTRVEFFVALFVLYIALGAVLETLAMIVITVPLLFPVLDAYSVNPIIFGVLLVLFIEVGQITPPFGMNLFVVHSTWDGRLEDVVRGALPFVGIIVLAGIMIVFMPWLALWLPSSMTLR